MSVELEDFPLLKIYKFDLSGIRFQTSFGGGNLNFNDCFNDFHHQIRFGIWEFQVEGSPPLKNILSRQILNN
jgi:hypothetical protein